MRALLHVVMSLALASVAPAAAQAPGVTAPAAPATAVTIEPPSFELGAIAPGSSQARTFLVRNAGPTAVKVTSSFPSCKCTTLTDLAGKEIPAGGTLELKASLDAPRAPGPKDAKVFVKLEGVERPLVAKIEGTVTLPVQPSPPYVDALKGNRKGVIDLTAGDGKPFRVLSVDGAAPQFTDFDPAKDAPRSHYLVRWDLSMVPDGKFRQWMLVETDRDDCALIPLRVRNEGTGSRFDPNVDKRGSFLPESVVVAGRMKPGESRDLELELEGSAPKGKPQQPYWDRVLAAHCKDAAAHAQLLEVKPEGADRVRVKFRFTLATSASGFVYAPVSFDTGTMLPFTCFVAAVAKP